MTRRNERVAEAIRRLISETIHGKLRDPRIGDLVTITKVEVTQDLRLAKIFYSVLGDDKAKKLVAKGLKSAKGFLRRQIADELKMRYTADILFIIDETAEHKARIDEILEKIHEEGENEKNKSDNGNDQKM